MHAARLRLQRAGGAGRFAQLVGLVEMVRDAGVARRAVDERAGLDVLMVVRQIVQLERAARGQQERPERTTTCRRAREPSGEHGIGSQQVYIGSACGRRLR